MLKIIIYVFVTVVVLGVADYFVSGKKGVIKDNKQSYISAIFFAAIYLIWGIYIIRDNCFYSEIKETIFKPKFLWCGASSLIGLSLAASQKRFQEKLLYLQFLIFYPFVTLLISSLIYSLLSLKEPLDNNIFYPFLRVIKGRKS